MSGPVAQVDLILQRRPIDWRDYWSHWRSKRHCQRSHDRALEVQRNSAHHVLVFRLA